ncbi:hypothetical protein M3Y97_00835700 [Aphelenchoides bicaudatus]|nr:hypothetical protein M3Y97_00835700 [Aphelenchoides bicaudatus]
MVTQGTLQSVLMVYVFPIQFTIGILGNVLNLIVLLNKRMRTKTNVLLSIMAFADIGFLAGMMPHSLAYHKKIMQINEVRVFLVYTSQHFAGICNTCSFISAWIICLLTVERMCAILFPLKSRLFWTYKTLRCFVILILLASLLVSLHLHISHKINVIVRNKTIFNATTKSFQKSERPIIKSMMREGWERYWRISTLLDTIFLVFIPVIIVVISTSSIVYTLHKKQPASVFLEKEPHEPNNNDGSISPIKRSATNNSARNQRRATFIVVIIAASFTLFQIPSAITHILQIMWPEIVGNSEFISATTITNSLVITTKMMNLFLFCMWSANFRRNLSRIINTKLENFKDSWMLAEPKEELKLTQLHTYSDPNTPNKRSFSYLTRPLFLQTRHSLPVKTALDADDCVDNDKTEQDGLLK